MVHRARTVPAALGGVAVTALGAAGWRFADRVLRPAARTGPIDDQSEDGTVTVHEATADAVVVSGGRAALPGRWGLAWPGGYAQVGTPTATAGDRVRRPLVARLAGGDPPVGPAVMDSHLWPDPAALGLPWEEVTYHAPTGAYPAWRIGPSGGPAGTWAVVVHGRGGRRSEGLRYVPALAAAGLTCLVIGYRNDADAPPSPDGFTHLGAAEWHEVESGVVYALSQGAERLVLVGMSMGGTAVLTFLRRSRHADAAAAAILDAPVLDWPAVLREGAARHGVPGAALPLLLPTALAIVRLRAGVRWDEIDHLRHADQLRHPLLLVHGADDDRVPVAHSDAFARARPDLVRYVRVPLARHVQSWNVDPDGVDAEVASFLAEHLRAGRRSRRGPGSRRHLSRRRAP